MAIILRRSMINKPSYSFLMDINGDKCAKILMGIIVAAVWVILSIVAFFYSLCHVVMTPAIVDSVLISLATYSAAVLGFTVFQKARGVRNDEKTN